MNEFRFYLRHAAHNRERGGGRSMVRLITILLLPLLSLVAQAGAASVSMDEKEAPRKRPAIEKVVIEENGVGWDVRDTPPEALELCADFILNESDVRQFFKVARFSTSHENVHGLDVSRCYASGRIVLRDGQEATWQINRARSGILWFSDDSTLYFFCGKCRSKAYWKACDIDCINER
jgi:hypothetical protein